MAHVRALLRRTAAIKTNEPYNFADLTLSPASRLAHRGEREIKLTAKEYDLLELFMRHPNQVLTREQIFEQIWGYDFGGESNIIEVYIRYLRSKLEKNNEPRLLHTVRGVGYVLRE
jgi:DNA-binding response OmpR family regulator